MKLFSWLRRKLRPPRRLRFTREGRVIVILSIGVGFAAINTGNNLLYLLLGWLLSCSPWPLYAAHLPRLVEHVGERSAAHAGWSLHGARQTFEYPGDRFDALTLERTR